MKKFFKILMVFALLGGATLSCTKDYSQEVVDLKAQDENLKALIASLQSALDAANQTIETLKANKLETSVFEAYKAELSAALAKAQGAADAAGNLATENKEAILKLASDLKNLKDYTEALKQDVLGNTEEITKFKSALTAQQAALEKAIKDGDDATLKAALKAVEDAKKEIEANEALLAQLIQANADAIGELQKSLDALSGKLEELEKKVDAYYKELNDKIAALAGRIQSIVADAPVNANEVSTLIWGDAPVLTANEGAVNGPATTITHVDMTFTILPAECAKAIVELWKKEPEKVELIVTEGLDVTRATPTPDKDKPYVPAVVEELSGGKVKVHANINPRYIPNGPVESAYWVALKVNAPDEQNGSYYKMSQFVKATETAEPYNLFEHAAWFKNGKTYIDADVIEVDVFMPWQANVPAGKEDCTMPWSKNNIFGDYELHFIMPDETHLTPAEVGTLFGFTPKEVEVAPSKVSTVWYAANGTPVSPGSTLTQILTFNKTGNVVDFAAQFPAGSTTVQNREYVGAQAKYHYGSQNGASYIMTIGGRPLYDYGICYTAHIAHNTIHSLATDDKLVYKWDYVHYSKTDGTAHPFENCTWKFKDMTLDYAAATWSVTDSIYTDKGVLIPDTGRKATITKTAMDLFTFAVDSIQFGTTPDATRNLYAAYTKCDTNEANKLYTIYSTEIPFTVEPRHDKVQKTLTLKPITPRQSGSGAGVITNIGALDYAFDDYTSTNGVAWDGSHAGKTGWTKAKLYDAFTAGWGTTGIHPVSVKENGANKTASLKEAILLTFTHSGTSDRSTIEYYPGTFAYGKKYELVFEKVMFGVPFIWTVNLTTNPSPYTLTTTPIVADTLVVKDNMMRDFELHDVVVLAGRSQDTTIGGVRKNWFTFEQIHFNKYLEVEIAKDGMSTFAGEDIKLVFTTQPSDNKLYRFSYSPSTSATVGSVDFSTLAASPASTTTKTVDGKTTAIFADNAVLDWNTVGANAFKGRKITVTATLKVGSTIVDTKTLTFIPEEPILKLATTGEFNLEFTPGEDLVIDLYEKLSVKGVYHGNGVKPYSTELLKKQSQFTWDYINTQAAPSYDALLPIIAPAKYWTATLNGEKFVLTEANYTIEGNKLTLKKDNNPGTITITIPVVLKSCLDAGSVIGSNPDTAFDDFKSISQYAEIKVTAKH